MTTYANRGKTFETYIEYCNEIYKMQREGLIVKQHTHFLPIRNKKGKVVSCKVEETAICDYLGMFHGQPVAIEAKETKKGSIRFDAVQSHQADFLRDFETMGGKAFVVISFDFKRFFCVPWRYWNAWYLTQYNAFNAEAVDGWPIPSKKSVRPEELLPEWEVKAGLYGALDYLACMRK